MNFFRGLCAALLALLIWAGYYDGLFAPRVSLNSHSDIRLVNGKVVFYSWWAVGVHYHGEYTCVKTLSEENGETYADALACYNKTKAGLK